MTREKAIKYIKDFLEGRLHSSYTGDAIVPALEYAVEVLESMRHGHWVGCQGEVSKLDNRGCITKETVFCSECGEYLDASDEYAVKGRFCPSCGANMSDVPVKKVKRLETYNGDFKKAINDWNLMCSKGTFKCSECEYHNQSWSHNTAGCFVYWLMEEIEVEE